MIRPVLTACLTLLPAATFAKPAGLRLEAEITAAAVPDGIAESAAFGERAELDGDWLAVSERSGSSGERTLKVHLFKREADGWNWKQALDLGQPWAVALDRLPPFDLEDGRLVVANPFPGGVTIYTPGEAGEWAATDSLPTVGDEPCYGSQFMRLKGDLLFLPEPVDGGRILILSKSAPASGWQVEAIVPWPVIGNPNTLPEYPSYDTDGSRLILRSFVRTSQEALASQVEILSRANGWQREALVVAPPASTTLYFNVARGSTVAIDGDEAWVLKPNEDFLGNPRGPTQLCAFRRIGKRWAAAGTTKTSNTPENSVAAGQGLVTTFQAGDSTDYPLIAFAPEGIPATLYRPTVWKIGTTAEPVTGVSFGGSNRFSTNFCPITLEDNGADGTVQVYSDPLGFLYGGPILRK